MNVSQNSAEGVLEPIWRAAFDNAVADELIRSQISAEQWRAGGRATKANPNKEDGEWWATAGYDMFKSFTEWWEANNNWYIWQTPQGDCGVELGLFSDFNGVPVRAYADLVCYDQDGILSVVDFKTGTYMPYSAMQLGLYATLIEVLFGVRPQRGYYYNARKAIMEPTVGLDRWTKPVFDELFGQFQIAVQHEIFLPNIGMMCGSCGVKDMCYAYSGAVGIDPLGDL